MHLKNVHDHGSNLRGRFSQGNGSTSVLPISLELTAALKSLPIPARVETMFYGLRKLDAAEAQRAFSPIHKFLLNKWWFDELFDCIFVRPCHVVSNWISKFDRTWIDGLIDSLAWGTRVFARYLERIADRTLVDGFVNGIAAITYRCGASLRRIQTGNLRQYVMFIVVGTVVVFALASFWRYALAQ